jgi:hypothetical protein
MDERERLLSKLERYLTIRDRISDGLAVAVIEELIRETEESLTQIENNAPDQKVMQPPSERGAAMTTYRVTLRDRETQSVVGYYNGSWTTDRCRAVALRKRNAAEAHAARMRDLCPQR